MSGIETIQKVNKLAQELLNQKIVTSREDAVKKAQEMLNKEIPGNDLQIKESGNRQNIAAADDGNLRNLISRQKEQMDRQFEGYKNALIGLEKELKNVKAQVQEIAMKMAGRSATQINQQAPQQQLSQPSQQRPSEERKDPNPRTGSHNPKDVAVEKMFYFGNKK